MAKTARRVAWQWALALSVALSVMPGPVPAETADGVVLVSSQRPKPRPEASPAATADSPDVAAELPVPRARPVEITGTAPAVAADPARDPGRGAVTNLPLPRFVSLKGNTGNARRGPGMSHRVDWVFTQEGMPLRVTAEYENWRRIEDAEGFGGWVHYALLSGTRSVVVSADRVALRSDAAAEASVVAEAEHGVVGRLLACAPDWCRVDLAGYRGWAPKAALWGVAADEVVD
jgi:SH3-like domain-containing protein